MSRFWNSRTRALSPYVPGEQPRHHQYIKLNTNENPYPPSPKTLEAIARAADQSLRLYPDPECLDLRRAFSERFGVKPAQVFAANGSDEALAFAFAAFFESSTAAGETAAGEATSAAAEAAAPILFPDITYSFYPVYARLWGIPAESPPLKADFSIDPADYLRECGGVIFANPNAPTGIAMDATDILAIAAYQAERGRTLIVDEAYADFSDAPSLMSHIDDHPNLLIIRTLSKSASLAGLRVGFAVGNEDLIEGLCRVRDSFNSYPVDRLAQAGAAAALRDAPYYADITRAIAATRERTAASLAEKGCYVLPSRANFLFVRHPVLNGVDFLAKLRAAGILARRFTTPRIADFVRITIGSDPDMDILLASV